ncbi:hypothetical protein SAMN04515648_1014 [Phyllobacterium sp. CL33Tsu]|uniref:hypothetical protein n=1 Tax=Phyllobacterium sp. CL33Tsu TaxID=1798191 RepID=UPI0008E5AB1F|nr:hypothetical protein [Phyllobacterium sp. CL33Tsu]SFI65628.1 hypothetical protein SAMN04515648_1014 [Phyllobacterium sp. CL33Tsu]
MNNKQFIDEALRVGSRHFDEKSKEMVQASIDRMVANGQGHETIAATSAELQAFTALQKAQVMIELERNIRQYLKDEGML